MRPCGRALPEGRGQLIGLEPFAIERHPEHVRCREARPEGCLAGALHGCAPLAASLTRAMASWSRPRASVVPRQAVAVTATA